MNRNLNTWLESHSISFSQIDEKGVYQINNEKYLFLKPKDGIIIDSDFELIFSSEEGQLISKYSIFKVIFEFGEKYYWSLFEEKLQLNILKYIGKAELEIDNDIPFLGIHSGYEICNGSRLYKDWCKKAAFLGISSLGICEKNTLAGALNFQSTCKDYNINSIIGETLTLRIDEVGEFEIKFYVKNKEGWRNLLILHSKANVHSSDTIITVTELQAFNTGLFIVFDDPEAYTTLKQIISLDDLYFQINLTEFDSNEKDKDHLDKIQYFLAHSFIKNKVKPILINDAYYLDQDDYRIKKILNKAGGIGFQNQSKDQYFKSQDELFSQFLEFTDDDNQAKAIDFFNQCIESCDEIAEKCKTFKIETGIFKLPQYILTAEEKKKYKTPQKLFHYLIEKGFKELLGKENIDESIYRERINTEIEVIDEGGFIDYFLIIWDILNWARLNGIATGTGRGSVGGSLLAFLLGITKIDPIKYGLLFERFLNRGRLKTSLPDIDSDFSGSGRDKVKHYVESKYGKDNVASIGTYPSLKIRAVIKELARHFGIPPQTVNYFTSMIEDDCDLTGLFKEASSNVKLKEFIQEHGELVNLIELCFEQPKNTSIHAAGLIISPKIIDGEEYTIYEQMPIKKNKDLLVTEWEGEYTEKAGFLKADILGIKQLEKFTDIILEVKNELNEEIDLSSINLDDSRVYELFQQGLNEDVFQFGAPGLKAYTSELKPRDINDLIATIALYRPGPIEIKAHIDYIKIRNGFKEPEYDYLCEEITKDTQSLLIYQEQIMKTCQILGGFTLIEADDIRKAMGKSKMDVMLSYKERFINGALSKGCTKYNAERIWDKMVGFANYCFNKAHSVAYALTGYQSQWLKVHYPLQFWTISLRYSSNDELPLRINEIKKTGSIKILPPDINRSQAIFTSSTETQSIYWSIESIHQAGEVAVKALMEERELNGRFFSFSEFKKRVEKKKINKAVITNLILTGCFDEIEQIQNARDRYDLLKKHLGEKTSDWPEEITSENIVKEHFWILKQKELCGFGYLDYEKIYSRNKLSKGEFLHVDKIDLESSCGYNKCLIGTVSLIVEKESKRGKFCELTINHNDMLAVCIVWAEIWPAIREDILSSKNKIMLITGRLKFDNFKKRNVLQTDSSTKYKIL
jgi:DNA polymerase-3 subunit alpha